MQERIGPFPTIRDDRVFRFSSRLEPGAFLRVGPGGHAAEELCLVGTTALAGLLGLDGRTGVHPREGHVLLSFLAVAAEEAGAEAVELGAVGGDLEARREVLSQEQRRAVALRDLDLGVRLWICIVSYRQKKDTPSGVRRQRQMGDNDDTMSVRKFKSVIAPFLQKDIGLFHAYHPCSFELG